MECVAREQTWEGKYHCTADLLFILFGFSCFTHVELASAHLLDQIQTGKTGGQLYSDSSHSLECFLM